MTTDFPRQTMNAVSSRALRRRQRARKRKSATEQAGSSKIAYDPTFMPPPVTIPDELYDAYTLGRTVDVEPMYFDQRSGAKDIVYTIGQYKEAFKQLKSGSFQYYGKTLHAILSCLQKFPVAGKTVLVCGSTSINCDAIALLHGAKRVYIVDYNNVQSQHPDVECLSMAEYARRNLQCDVAFSISSFEHDGLGRYGDPLNPWGDIEAMRNTQKFVKPNGLLFLAVPIGKDAVIWNAHRIYGPLRLPLLLAGWKYRGSSGFLVHDFLHNTGTNFTQPVIVLENQGVRPDMSHAHPVYELLADVNARS